MISYYLDMITDNEVSVQARHAIVRIIRRRYTFWKPLTYLRNIIGSAGSRGSQHHLAGNLGGQLVRSALVVARAAALVTERASRQRRRRRARVLHLAGTRLLFRCKNLAERREVASAPLALIGSRSGLCHRAERQRCQHGDAPHPHTGAYPAPPHTHTTGTKCTGWRKRSLDARLTALFVLFHF